MSAKRESKQPVPSVMARLMGLDEMPPQQPVQKKPRVLSENYLRRVASIGVREKYSKCHPFRLNIEEDDESKNVLRILGTLKRKNNHSMPVQKQKVHLDSSEVKMKFLVPKHVSEDSRPQSLKESRYASTVTDSETDSSLKYFQKSGLWDIKKLNEPNDVHFNFLSGHVALLKSPCASDCRNIGMCKKFRRKTKPGYVHSLKKFQDSLGTYSSEDVRFGDMNRLLKSNNRSCLPITSIIVLNSDLGKAGGAARRFSLASRCHEVSHSGNAKKKETLSTHNGNLCVRTKQVNTVANSMVRVCPRSRFSRAKTRKVGHDIITMLKDQSRSEISGSNLFEKESESTIPSPILSDRKSQFSLSDELYAMMEDKKQISERWKMTKGFQQVQRASRSKTLNEMLSIPDKPGECGLSKQAGPENGSVNFGISSGISNCDNFRNECVRDLATSKSLLAYFNAVASPNSRTSHESLENGGFVGDVGSTNMVQDKSSEQDFNQRDGSECRSSDFSYKRSLSIPYFESKNNHSVGNNYVIQNELESKLKDTDLGSETSIVSKPSGQNNQMLQDTWMKQEEHKNKGREEDLPEQEIFNGIIEEDSSSQCSGTDPESVMSFEDGYQPSPNSVLEPLYKKGISSSSDCFKSVNASLHGLHMQLELLKSKRSEVCSKGSSNMVSTDDEYTEEGSIKLSDENEGLMRSFRIEESRDFSYLVDVLTEAGFHNTNLHLGFYTWLSEECSICQSVFESLETKYGKQVSWKRSERRLLFDRINSGLTQILQPSMGVQTWREPVARRFSYSQGQSMIEEELWMLLVSQEKEVSKESEKFLGKDDGWLELGDGIRVIGIEIENSLIDELVADVSMEIF